jgi:uncharacterized membrane protein
MENSVFLAKLLGLYLIVVCLGFFFNMKTYQKLMEDFFKNSALIYLSGVMALFFGLLLILYHNVWEISWAVIITIFGWLGFIKVSLLIIFPNVMSKVSKAYQKKPSLLGINLLIMLAMGILLSIKGYFSA